jgi:hypothetical protein
MLFDINIKILIAPAIVLNACASDIHAYYA